MNKEKFPSIAEIKNNANRNPEVIDNTVWEEVEEMRTDNVKTYKGSNGKMKKVITVQPPLARGSINTNSYNGLNCYTIDEFGNELSDFSWLFGSHESHRYYAVGELNLNHLYQYYGVHANTVLRAGIRLQASAHTPDDCYVAYNNSTSEWTPCHQDTNDTFFVPFPEPMTNGEINFCMTNDGDDVIMLDDTYVTYEIEYEESEVDYKQSYVEGSVGKAGSYRVNTRTGRFEFSRELINLGGERMPLNLSITYNPYAMPNGFENAFGYWKFNIEQYVKSVNDEYLYIDGEYKTHTFKQAGNSGIYYDTGHTGLTLTSSGNTTVITDNKINTLTFRSGRLEEIKTQKGSTPLTMMIAYTETGFTVTDGLGRQAIFTKTETGGTLTKPNGLIITFTLDGNVFSITENTNSCTYSKNTISSYNGELLSVQYNQGKVSEITESIVKEESTKALRKYVFTYAPYSTDVTYTKYPNSTSEYTKKTTYAFADNGETINTFEKTNKDNKENANDIRYRSTEDYKRYMLYLNPEFSKKGTFYPGGATIPSEAICVGNNDWSEVVFEEGIPPLNYGEELILSLQITPSASSTSSDSCDVLINAINFEDATGYLKVGTIRGGNEMQTILYVLPQEYVDLNLDCYFVSFEGNMEVLVENARINVKKRSSEVDCINLQTVMSSHTERNNVWYEDTDCIINGTNVNLSKNDWEQTLENMHKAGNGNFLLWYNDLSSAMLVNKNTVVSTVRESKPLHSIRYATMQEKGTRSIFEYRDYDVEDSYCRVTQTTKLIERTGITYKTCYYYYDDRYNLIKTIDSKGVITEYTYNAYGEVIKQKITADGKIMETESNTSVTDNDITSTSSEYLNGEECIITQKYNKATGNMSCITDARNNDTTMTYDDDDNLRTIEMTLNNTTTNNVFEYESGLLEKITHNGFTYDFERNVYNDVIQVKIGDNVLLDKEYTHAPGTETAKTNYDTVSSTTNTYNKYGHHIKRKDVNSTESKEAVNIYASVFDDVENVENPEDETLTVNADSKLRKSIDKNRVVLYNYDGIGNVTSYEQTENGNNVLTVTNSYDYDNRLQSTTEEVADESPITTTYTYENGDGINEDRIKRCEVVYEENSIGDYVINWDNTYDKFNRITRKISTYSVYDGSYEFEVTDDYLYYGGKALGYTTGYVASVSREMAMDHTVVGRYEFDYEYDKNGNVTKNTQDREYINTFYTEIYEYTYDKLNRLIQENNTTYEYDNGGNRTKKTVGNTITTYQYDKDRLISINGVQNQFAYDNKGYPTKYKGENLTWKYNRLASYGNNVSYDYNANNVRIQKTVGSTRTDYYYEGSKLLLEKRGNDKLVYVYRDSEIIGFVYNNEPYIYMKNPQGDIIEIHHYEYGLVATYTYDAWGNCSIGRNEYGIGTLNPFRYRSYYYDTDTGLYYLINRYYDPELGRFISPDHLGYMMEQMESINGCNLYAYCLNNPIMGVDPEGTFLWFLAVFAISFVVNTTVSAATQFVTTGEVDWGVALVDGAFGAVSDVISVIPGVGQALGTAIDVGLTFANNVITTGMQNDWKYSGGDIVNIIGCTVFSGVTSHKLGKKKIDMFDTSIANNTKNAIRNSTFKSVPDAVNKVGKGLFKTYTSSDALISQGLDAFGSLLSNIASLLY